MARWPSIAATVLAFGLLVPWSEAIFTGPETQQVPIGRLFANLEQRLARQTNDFPTTYYLARLHAMAYSTNLLQFPALTNQTDPVFGPFNAGVPPYVFTRQTPAALQVARQHLTNAILLYERAAFLLRQSTNAAAHAWLVLPLELGHAWCLDQAGRREEALTAYRRTLKIAWKKEVEGEFNFTDWLKERWDDIQAGRNPLGARSRRGRGYLGPGVCFSKEVIGYLLKLLDPVKDAKEIAELRQDQDQLLSMGRAVTPIVVPLGTETQLDQLVCPDAAVSFDLDGSGWLRPWGWITPQAAWLVYDADGSGRITSGLQMFGAVTFWIFWRDGYDALSALDADGDGLLCGDELRGLALWQDQNGDGISDPGEVLPLAAFGITAISCASESHPSGIRWNACGVQAADGTWRPTYDWLAPSGETKRPAARSLVSALAE